MTAPRPLGGARDGHLIGPGTPLVMDILAAVPPQRGQAQSYQAIADATEHSGFVTLAVLSFLYGQGYVEFTASDELSYLGEQLRHGHYFLTSPGARALAAAGAK